MSSSNEKSESRWNLLKYLRRSENSNTTPTTKDHHLKESTNPEIPSKSNEDQPNSPLISSNPLPNNDNQATSTGSLSKTILRTLLISGTITAAASAAPWLLGFGTAGVKAGSFAACIQSGIGDVTAGSLFSIMTSLGAKGVYLKTLVGGLTAAVAGGIGPKGEGKDKGNDDATGEIDLGVGARLKNEFLEEVKRSNIQKENDFSWVEEFRIKMFFNQLEDKGERMKNGFLENSENRIYFRTSWSDILKRGQFQSRKYRKGDEVTYIFE